MKKKFLWKIGGEAGFGIKTTGLLFSQLALKEGLSAFNYTEYPSLVRGGHNTYEVVLSDEDDVFLKKEIDLLVALNKDTYLRDKGNLSKEAIVIFDDSDFSIEEKDVTKVSLPMNEIVKENNASYVAKNMVALGASAALLSFKEETVRDILIKFFFKKKGEKVAQLNLELAKEGFRWIENNVSLRVKMKLKRREKKSLIMTGNDAFSCGAVVSDCRLYAAYPMTPASSVLSNLSLWAKETGMVVRHTEDEIAAVNTALGASFAGVRSAVGTSGGGFALMAESISLAGMTELPVVIFLAQRVGPATGMPTWTEQGDLLFSVFVGHGDFPKIVLAPSDSLDMIELSAKSFNLAEIYQLPVIILSDKLLSESFFTVDRGKADEFIRRFKIDRGKTIFRAEKGYLRYKITADGVSPRLIPYLNSGVYYQANSYEHLEDTHTTEDFNERIKQVDKRERKLDAYLKHHFEMPTVFGDLSKAKIVLVGWGSVKHAVLDALDLLKDKGKEVAFIHFTHLFPLSLSVKSLLSKEGKRYISIEQNKTAQFKRLLRMELGVSLDGEILRYDGRPFWPEDIVREVINLD